MTLLAQDGFNVSVFAPKRCQLFLRHFNVLSTVVQTIPLSQFFGQQLEFAFRTPSEFRVGTITFAPFAVNVGKPDSDIKWVVTDLDLSFFNGWIAHGFTPVIQMIDPDADPRLNLCCAFASRGKSRLEEGVIVLNMFVNTLTILLHAHFIRIAWCHTQRWMA